MNELVLERTVTVVAYDFVGRVAVTEKRPELYALLMQAKAYLDDGRQLTARDVCDPDKGLLAGWPLVIGERLLALAHEFKLAEGEKGRPRNIVRLTGDGESALQQQEVLVPRSGQWRIWLAEQDDILQGERSVLVVEEPTPDRGGQFGGKVMPTPKELKLLEEKKLEVLYGTHRGTTAMRTLRIDKVDPTVEKMPTSARATLRWTLPRDARPELHLSGKVGAWTLDRLIEPPPCSFETVWREILKAHGRLDRWNDELGRLLCTLHEVEDRPLALETLATRLPSTQIRLPELGKFDVGELHDVPVYPLDDAEARRWAEGWLIQQVQDHVWPDQFARLREKAINRFPDRRFGLSEQGELAATLRAQATRNAKDTALPSVYWRLQTCLDLG
ncbi:MAG: hypothetical protein KatS3mg102_0712 [Planctomycetota bacterium]|nr:MAG: hypothetical protein KatS3mg102_0712 [Planctomycetota bacterium]